jgi:hypothetical protein
MAGVSKNQRVAKKPVSGPYVESGDTTRLVPLGAGYCYIRDPRDGRTHHVKVNSTSFQEIMTAIATVTTVENRLVTELGVLATNANRFGAEWLIARAWFAQRNDVSDAAVEETVTAQ